MNLDTINRHFNSIQMFTQCSERELSELRSAIFRVSVARNKATVVIVSRCLYLAAKKVPYAAIKQAVEEYNA